MWELPEIFDGNTRIDDVVVGIDPLIASYVTFNEQELTLEYSGEAFQDIEVQLKTQIDVTLVNFVGQTSYT